MTAEGAAHGSVSGPVPLPPPSTTDITATDASGVDLAPVLVGGGVPVAGDLPAGSPDAALLEPDTGSVSAPVAVAAVPVAGVPVVTAVDRSDLTGVTAAVGAASLSGGIPTTVPPDPGTAGQATAPSAVAVEGATPDGGGTPAGHRAHRTRGHRWWLWGTVVAVVLAMVAAGLVSAQRINRPLHAPAAATALPASLSVAGASPSLPWPSQGQAAVAVPALGFAAQSGPETPVPIASVTKMTNALVILTDHPIPAGASGPDITITAQDMAEYENEVHNDESNVRVQLGEVLTERQMLEAMLSQSANNIAFSLAVWDAGTTDAFVAKMNAAATQLGATHTHYVDVSGFQPGSVSSASDCIRVASAGMAIPTFAEVVGMSTVTLPLVGTLPNIVSEIGTTIGGNKIVGIKSGYTSEAKGCLVLAADRVIDGRSVLVLAAVLGQPVPPPIVPTTTTTRPRLAPTTTTTTKPGTPPTTAPPVTAPPATLPPEPTTTIPVNDLQVPDPLRYTRPVTEALVTATAAAVLPVVVATAGQPTGTVTARWGGVSHQVAVKAATGAWVAGWPGQQVRITTALLPVPPGARSGRTVGTATYSLGTQSEVVPLRLAATVPEPSWWWRLIHN